MTDEAPRTNWATKPNRNGHMLSGPQYDGGMLYHHDDVVRELVEALKNAKAFHDRDEGCNGFTADYEILRAEIDHALAKVAQEGR